MEQGPLAALRPLHMPPPVPWWPPAPGWWVVFGLILLSFGIALFWWLRRTRYRRAALKELRMLKAKEVSAAEVNRLLKRYALVCFPRTDVAALNGKDWISFLNDTAPKLRDRHFTGLVEKDLLEHAYRDGIQAEKDLITFARAWIRSIGPGHRKAVQPGKTH